MIVILSLNPGNSPSSALHARAPTNAVHLTDKGGSSEEACPTLSRGQSADLSFFVFIGPLMKLMKDSSLSMSSVLQATPSVLALRCVSDDGPQGLEHRTLLLLALPCLRSW